ncbi:hypothetical protein RHSIM_Rhsim05G0213100 [Rhododendron simsii]|uniref:Uncharacterized protein n=1 Tax=Rhododendron simsii TaxID=118357 RepID=A0A834GYW3_RHOSS|nr:hypothetical protein RHSIM_Rhsim05G0213100 [Rhododendron simsii]
MFLRPPWPTFRVMRTMPTGRSDLGLRMFKGSMFLPIFGEWIFQQTSLGLWLQTLIKAHVGVKTTDRKTAEENLLRMFCIGFTKKRANQQKRTCYAQSS